MSISIRMVVSIVIGMAALLVLAFLTQNQTAGFEDFVGSMFP